MIVYKLSLVLKMKLLPNHKTEIQLWKNMAIYDNLLYFIAFSDFFFYKCYGFMAHGRPESSSNKAQNIPGIST